MFNTLVLYIYFMILYDKFTVHLSQVVNEAMLYSNSNKNKMQSNGLHCNSADQDQDPYKDNTAGQIHTEFNKEPALTTIIQEDVFRFQIPDKKRKHRLRKKE